MKTAPEQEAEQIIEQALDNEGIEHGFAYHEKLRTDDNLWHALEPLGIQECYGLRGPDEAIELRNCTCGSTLGRRCIRRPQ